MKLFLEFFGGCFFIILGGLAILWSLEGIALAHAIAKVLVDGGYLVWSKKLKKLVPKSLAENDVVMCLDDEVDSLVKRVTALEKKLEGKEE